MELQAFFSELAHYDLHFYEDECLHTLNLTPNNLAFLVASGLPEAIAPFTSFDEILEPTNCGEYVAIGQVKGRGKLLLSTIDDYVRLQDGEVVSYVAPSLVIFVATLLHYRRLCLEALPLVENLSQPGQVLPDHLVDDFENLLQVYDGDMLITGAFWPTYIEKFRRYNSGSQKS